MNRVKSIVPRPTATLFVRDTREFSGPCATSTWSDSDISRHSAAAAAKGNPSYRYVALPDRVDLSTSANRDHYAKAAVTIPAIATPAGKSPATIPAARVAWGLTIPSKSAHREAAVALLRFLSSAEAADVITKAGLKPLTAK